MVVDALFGIGFKPGVLLPTLVALPVAAVVGWQWPATQPWLAAILVLLALARLLAQAVRHGIGVPAAARAPAPEGPPPWLVDVVVWIETGHWLARLALLGIYFADVITFWTMLVVSFAVFGATFVATLAVTTVAVARSVRASGEG
jgi:hypothetical protein